jgi:DNA-binding transcriptional LysR family regulator
MEVRQLQIFRALAEELNFTRTAERVHTVQSNVTAQIKALEEELGAPLFDRLGRRVTLTDAGRRFQPFAEQALAAMEQGERAICNEPSGPLRISAPESILTYRLPVVLRNFRRKFPHVEISFRSHIETTLVSELETGKLDLVINMCDNPSNPAHKSFRFHTERIFLLAEPGHPFAKRRTIKPSDLAGQQLLLTEAGCGYRAKLDKVLAMQNIRPGHITEFSSVEAIKQCVCAGMGLALLPAIVVARELRQNQFKALHWNGPSLDIGTHVLWHKDKWVSPAMTAFLDLIKAQVEHAESTDHSWHIQGTFAD